jgi:hypothetical protein
MTPEERHHLSDGLRRAYDDSQEAQARDIIALGLRKINKGGGGRRGTGAVSAKSLGRSAAAAKGALGKIKFPGLKR